MNIIKSKSAKKYFDTTCKKVIARKNKYFRRNVHVNHEETHLRILRIKNDEQFSLEVKGYKWLPNDVCFFFFHLEKTENINEYLEIDDSDFIITNSKTNRIISLNTLPKEYPDFFNLWIVKKNTISFLKLKIDDIFFTR